MPTGHRTQTRRSALVVVAYALFAAGVCILFSAPQSAEAQTPVTACGQLISGAGILTGDLDCSAFPDGVGFVIGKSGRLDLKGFTLTSGQDSAIHCPKTCKIFSSVPGGAVVATGANQATASFFGENMSLIDVEVDGFDQVIWARRLQRTIITNSSGVSGGSKKLTMLDSEIDGNGGVCAAVGGTARIKRSTINGCNVGLRATKTVVSDSAITNASLDGIRLETSTGKDLLAKLTRTTVSGHGRDGLNAVCPTNLRVKLREATLTNNGTFGLFLNTAAFGGFCQGRPGTKPAQIRDSTLMGNGTAASCGVSETCADIASASAPEISGTTVCDASYDLTSGFPGTNWGVCALD